jgi:hypothetical protein
MTQTRRPKLLALSLCLVLLTSTGCQSLREALYEPVPYDQVAQQQGITLAQAEALNLQRPRAELQPLIDTASAILPSPAPLTSLALNAVLALGAIWAGSQKRTADKVSASLVQGIDTFRDILDQTPQGSHIDQRLIKTLRHHQHALQVQRHITKLLDRYATPSKRPIPLDTGSQRPLKLAASRPTDAVG